MRWEDQRRSENVEDRRGTRVRGGLGGGVGLGTIVLVLIVSWLTGANPLTLLQMAGSVGGGGGAPAQQAPTGAPAGDPQAEFAAVVLASTEDAWTRVF
ncbi:MAG: neutral zinc metallopeptidase, partial [Vicinamibacterales bacterium]